MKLRRCRWRIHRNLPPAVQLAAKWLGVFAAALGMVWLMGCPSAPSQPADTTEVAEGAPPATRTGYNFTPQQASSIIDNAMHVAHHDKAGIECKTCHQDPDEFLTHKQALALCFKCHSTQIVALEVWENHCLSCHQFVKYKEHYADSTHILRELCQGCHGEGSSMFWTAFDPSSPHDVTCDNCHHPHETALVVAGDLCNKCHEDITSKVSDKNKVHGSCIVCHTPHSELPKSEELCVKCHTPPSDVLVHNVPEHPKDCLACHSAHFTEAEITSDACLKCHDDTYYQGRSGLPYAHRDCESCHYVGNFQFKGVAECAKCHDKEGKVVARESLPDQHRTCLSCHKPHTWYTTFETICKNCHDVDKVIEHRLTFHQADCQVCHDPHHTELMAKSGHCSGCHGEGKFPDFRPDLNDKHLQCANCHSQVAIDSRDFSFKGVEASCLKCHTKSDPKANRGWDDVPSGHKVCQACHAAHTFESDASTMRCDLCHRDIFTKFPSQEHGECFNCHQVGHDPEFLGQDASCDVCHADIVALATNPVKKDCLVCHSPHEFTADPDVCAACHSDIVDQIPTGAQHADCQTCHGGHIWKPDDTVCQTCHAEPPELHASHADAGCANCHQLHSMAVDLSTCKLCHSDLPDSCTSDTCTQCHSFRAVAQEGT